MTQGAGELLVENAGLVATPDPLARGSWVGPWNLHFKPLLRGPQAQPSLRTIHLEEQMAKPRPTQRCYCSVTFPWPGPSQVLCTHSSLDAHFTDADAEAGPRQDGTWHICVVYEPTG